MSSTAGSEQSVKPSAEPGSLTSKCRLAAGGRDTKLILCGSYGRAGGVAEGKTVVFCFVAAAGSPLSAPSRHRAIHHKVSRPRYVGLGGRKHSLCKQWIVRIASGGRNINGLRFGNLSATFTTFAQGLRH